MRVRNKRPFPSAVVWKRRLATLRWGVAGVLLATSSFYTMGVYFANTGIEIPCLCAGIPNSMDSARRAFADFWRLDLAM